MLHYRRPLSDWDYRQPLVAVVILLWFADLTLVLSQITPGNGDNAPLPSNRSRNIAFFAPNSVLQGVSLSSAVKEDLASFADLCSPSPCQNNASCQHAGSLGASFVCICQNGWTGRLCNVDIDECADSVNHCQNGAMCRNLEGGFQCYCVPGYLGHYCESEANECLTHPCKNEGVCEDRLNGYDCTCPAGFDGKQCEKDINECEHAPCLNGATCNDLRANYSCTCIAGFVGLNCETDVDDCAHNPCQNGGRCVDGINNFTCNCVNTGFMGRHCEVEFDDCATQPCQHNGSCTDIGMDYKCQCFDGFLGRNCEVDINECLEPFPPCQNGATCMEKSNASLYIDQMLFGEPRVFSYNNAAGYICKCPAGFTGKNCEIQIDECETAPCVHGKCTDLINGYNCTCLPGWEGENCQKDIDECSKANPCSAKGSCENLQGHYRCNCLEGFGGKNCSVALVGCQMNQSACANGVRCSVTSKCAEGSTCIPFLSSEDPYPVHNFTCICTPGHAGRLCQHSSIASFSTDGFLQLRNQSLKNISFDFRTTLNESVLMVGLDTIILAVELRKGKVEVTIEPLVKPGDTKAVVFDKMVTDGKWRTVNLVLDKDLIAVSLVNPKASPEKQTMPMVNLIPVGMVFREVFFGGLEQRVRILEPAFRANMNGCMRDINMNGQVLVPSELIGAAKRRQSTVRTTCDRKEQCSPNTCTGRGRCTDLWNRYECICRRPFYGLSCEKEFLMATFNREGAKSIASLNFTKDESAGLELRTDFSFRLRTLENNSHIFYLGSHDGKSYMILRLVKGQLELVTRVSGKSEIIHGPNVTVSDGLFHYIRVQRDQTMIEIQVENEGVQPVFGQLAVGSPLRAEVLLLGGTLMLQSVEKAKREVEAAAGGVVKGLFKGILQDFRLNQKLVAIYDVVPDVLEIGFPPYYRNVVTEKMESGERSDLNCKSNPCQNGGTCEVTWNDFRCHCPVAFRGKNCTLPNFCLSNECPSPHAKCRKMEDDYECSTNITLLEPSSQITYSPTKFPAMFRKLSFRFRTRGTEASNILTLTSAQHVLKVFVKNSRIQVEYRLSRTLSVITIDTVVNDALWHSFEAEFLESITNINIDGMTFPSPDVARSEIALSAVLQEDNAQVLLGGGFIGCLDDARLGPYLLPVFPEIASAGQFGLRRIVKIEKLVAIEYGCNGSDVCRLLPPCAVGLCKDIWNARKCECDGEVEGHGCNTVMRSDTRAVAREGTPTAGCGDLVCRNGGMLVCAEVGSNVTEAFCNCTDGFHGTECDVHQVSASPATDQLAIILGVTLSVAGVIVIGALVAFCITARRRRAERGTYSPSRQEIFGSRVEMGYVLKPPPEERLI